MPLEIQTPNQSYPPEWQNTGVGTEGHTGPLPVVIDFALDRGVTSLELYPFEWRVAHGDIRKWRSYQREYDAALSRAAERLPVNGPAAGDSP